GPAPDRVLIGATREGVFGFNGLIDEVAIYDYPLSPAQVQSHYTIGAPPPPPPPTGDIIKFETNNQPNFALPSAFGSFATIPAPSHADYADANSGNGVTVAVAPGSIPLHPTNSAPIEKLIDGVIMD